ncbi:MAG: GNAT family N-acetyltransferase [Acidocella sp. 20-57-95]|nr:MAG: GNAT family N-acetyltransferase [Acidocella sp. 20-57-95]OYV62720.1 MAG: GNAT family N-acetyltransferase [Acidocella sp. 21-58-7]HQT65384.1 GNAT family protein [Acidocella sp.]HQU03271.1 GNAT family protein [Acidocella sp.]
MAEPLPVGPEVDAWPRPLPTRTPLTGSHVVLEPLHRRHTAELYEAISGADASFTYTPYGPFSTREAFAHFIANAASQHDPMTWAIRPVATGNASGWLGLMDIQPENAAIELGRVWFSPRLQRTRAATEAIFLLLKRAADELGYRRLVWKCDTLNAASIRAANRLGFTHEGTLRAHKIVKGRQRDSAMFSITADEWPSRRDAIAAWLSPDNFAPDGTARQSLAALRGR